MNATETNNKTESENMKALQKLIDKWKREATLFESDSTSGLFGTKDRTSAGVAAGRLRQCIKEVELVFLTETNNKTGQEIYEYHFEVSCFTTDLKDSAGLVVSICEGLEKHGMEVVITPKQIDETEEEVEKETLAGKLNKPFGIRGYHRAEVEHPVYQTRDRYVLYLKHDTLPGLRVPFYKSDLEQSINTTSQNY